MCTCMCQGAHTPVIHIHGDQKRTSGPALPSSYSLQTKFFSESAGTCHFWLGLACQQTHAPPASSTPEPCARLQAQASTAGVYAGVFVGPHVCALTPRAISPSLSVTS